MSKFKLSKLTAAQIDQLPADLQEAIAEMKAGSADWNDAAHEALAELDEKFHTMATNQLAKAAVKAVKKPAKATAAKPAAKKPAAAPKPAPKVKRKAAAAPKAKPKPTTAAKGAKHTPAELEAKRAANIDRTTGRKDIRSLTREEVLAVARNHHALRTLGGQMVDNAAINRKVLDPTPENLVRWMKDPAKFDMKGVDAPRATPATANLKISKDNFWKRLGL